MIGASSVAARLLEICLNHHRQNPHRCLKLRKKLLLTLEDNFGKKKNEKERDYIIM